MDILALMLSNLRFHFLRVNIKFIKKFQFYYSQAEGNNCSNTHIYVQKEVKIILTYYTTLGYFYCEKKSSQIVRLDNLGKKYAQKCPYVA